MRNKGWKIIENVLIQNNLHIFKVIRKDKFMSENEDQRGKDVTIYANFNPELRTRDWQKILEEITRKLVEAGVHPGYRPPDLANKPEKPVPGSNI